VILPPSSTGSPITFMIRPNVSGPTGIMIGSPVSIASMPRTSPVGRVHRDAADDVVAQVLGDLDDEVPLPVADARLEIRIAL